jgi:hypothetical protein
MSLGVIFTIVYSAGKNKEAKGEIEVRNTISPFDMNKGPSEHVCVTHAGTKGLNKTIEVAASRRRMNKKK